MTTIKDWKGNEIKAGMVIYFVNTNPGILESSRHGLFMPDGKQIWEPEGQWLERKNQKIWELGNSYEVIERSDGGFNLKTKTGDDTFIFPIEYEFTYDSIIAIKDISDQKPEL